MNRRAFAFFVVTIPVLCSVAPSESQVRPRRPVRRAGLTKDDYRTQMSAALDRIGGNEPAAPARGRQVQLHANLFLAHEAFIKGTPLDTLKRAVDAFKDAGFTQVDLNMGLFPFVDGNNAIIAKYDAVVRHIRAAGLRVAVNPQYSPLYHKAQGLDAWRKASLPVYAEIAERYQPDVFVVAHEPTTMAARLGARGLTPSLWADYVREATRVVKEKSPRSRIGAGGLATEEQYFDAFARLREVDVLTLDIYALKDLPTCERIARAAREKGKAVYVEETWRPPYYEPRPGLSLEQISVQHVGDPAFEPIDVKWVRAMIAWAAAHDVEGVTPVWMQCFFTYGGEGTGAFDPEYLRAVMAAIDEGRRTDTLRAIKDLAR